jgi:hypothetical protein
VREPYGFTACTADKQLSIEQDNEWLAFVTEKLGVQPGGN